jgi:hypothetical protein
MILQVNITVPLYLHFSVNSGVGFIMNPTVRIGPHLSRGKSGMKIFINDAIFEDNFLKRSVHVFADLKVHSITHIIYL